METGSHHYIPAYWCVVPAAGIGSRMGLEYPKQYLMLQNKTILEHTLERLLLIPQLRQILLPLHAYDTHWQQLPLAKNSRIHNLQGGSERSHSVLNALEYLKGIADDRDWVLVHDAARPCVTQESILDLINTVDKNPVGGILGIPVSDTLKKVTPAKVTPDRIIQETVDRQALWCAQTPQMFRLGLLHSCLKTAIDAQHRVTDESSALEFCGYSPLMVEGRSDNIKITRRDDIALVQFILNQQMSSVQ